MFIKFVILILFILILASLAASMFTYIRDKENKQRTAKLLTIRITLSIILFIVLGLSFLMGWIQPHPLLPPMQ
ncbi:MAG: putative copper export protein [Gammaproteobacteria bacterium]|jgi:putative copper export protein